MSEKKRRLLQRLGTFPGFSDDELDALAGVLVARKLAEAKVLFKEGDPGDACYLIVKGRLRLWVMREGKREPLAVLGRGDMFGQVALLDGGARTASCAALEEALVLVLKRNDFDLLYRSGSPFAFKFLDMLTRVLVGQLRNANRRLLSLAERQQKERLSRGDECGELREVARSTLAYQLQELDEVEVVVPDGLRDD